MLSWLTKTVVWWSTRICVDLCVFPCLSWKSAWCCWINCPEISFRSICCDVVTAFEGAFLLFYTLHQIIMLLIQYPYVFQNLGASCDKFGTLSGKQNKAVRLLSSFPVLLGTFTAYGALQAIGRSFLSLVSKILEFCDGKIWLGDRNTAQRCSTKAELAQPCTNLIDWNTFRRALVCNWTFLLSGSYHGSVYHILMRWNDINILSLSFA